MQKKQKIARQIVKMLVQKGYTAYFAGGWVRDFLLGNPSDDIDIATDATPGEIESLFPKTRLIGAHFGVVIVVIEGMQFEVATFRKDFDYIDGRHPTKIEPSNPFEDANRRDFTINGMFFDPETERIIDFVGGKQDLLAKCIRTIGNAKDRFVEDRLRMLRAIRFAAQLNFVIDPHTLHAIQEMKGQLFPAVSVERVWEELAKMGKSTNFEVALTFLYQTQVLSQIFPELENVSLEELCHRLAPYQNVAATLPLATLLLPLLQPKNVEEGYAFLEKFHRSRRDKSRLQCYFAIQSLFEKESSFWEWAHALAHPFAEETALLFGEKKEAIKQKKQALEGAISRIREKRPLVTASDLIARGVQPGKKMGEYLLKGEQLAINSRTDDKERVLKQLGLP